MAQTKGSGSKFDFASIGGFTTSYTLIASSRPEKIITPYSCAHALLIYSEKSLEPTLVGEGSIPQHSTHPKFAGLICDNFVGPFDKKPTVLVPMDDHGYHCMLQHLCPCLESMTFEELRTIDRWWLAALNHEDPKFGAAVRSHLYHWVQDSGSRVARITPVDIGRSLCYSTVVKEILASSRPQKHNFLTIVCSFGTPKTLQPFLDVGYDLDSVCEGSHPGILSPLQIALEARNFPILEALKARGSNFFY